jgi:hypothetical protein
VRRIVEDVARGVALHPLEEHLEGLAVEDVLAGMHLEAAVLAVLRKDVEDRLPALRELVERGLDEARRTLRPRI